MKYAAIEERNIFLILAGLFYLLLCVFSIVTGMMHASGKKKLNPLELSDSFMERFNNEEEVRSFSMRMGWITFGVGLLQGLTSFALFKADSPVYYWIAYGFTVFSLSSVIFKLRGRFSIFALLKLIAYVVIFLGVMMSRPFFFR